MPHTICACPCPLPARTLVLSGHNTGDSAGELEGDGHSTVNLVLDQREHVLEPLGYLHQKHDLEAVAEAQAEAKALVLVASVTLPLSSRLACFSLLVLFDRCIPIDSMHAYI